MAPERTVMTADAVPLDEALEADDGIDLSPRRNAKGQFVRGRAQDEPDPHETSEESVADHHETDDDAELDAFQEPEEEQTSHTSQAMTRQSGKQRVQTLLDEALRLGQQYGLIQRHPDGTLLLPGQVKERQRRTSDCDCPRCAPHHQQHWWCVICNSGPHDWHLVKPQFERQELNAGGIEGRRLAACSAQCARDFLAGLGRHASGQGVQPDRTMDPSLALPG